MLDIKLFVLLDLYLISMKNIYSFFELSFRDDLILKGKKIVLRELYHKITSLFEQSFRDTSMLNSSGKFLQIDSGW